MKLHSTRLGEMEVGSENVVNFSDGILGFPSCNQYAWINSGDPELPIELLQSLDDADLTFMITDPFLFNPSYGFDLEDDWKVKLDVFQREQVDVRVFVTVRANNQISINLKAPIIINNKNRLAAQIVLDNPDYSLQYLVKGE